MVTLAGGITPSDWLSSTTAILVAIIAVTGSVALSVYDRRARRKEVKGEWEKRADALTKQLSTSYAARLRDRDEQIRAITDDRNYWRSRWMGVRDDGGRGDRSE